MADALAQQLVEAKRHLIGSPRLEPPPPIATAGVTGGQPPPPLRHTRMSSSSTPMPDNGCSEHSLRDPRRPRPGFLHLHLLVRHHHLTLHPYTLDNHSSTTWRLSLFLPSKGWIVWSSPGSSGQSLLSYKTLFVTVVALLASLVLPSRSSSSATARLILATSMLPSRHSSIGATPPSTTAR